MKAKPLASIFLLLGGAAVLMAASVMCAGAPEQRAATGEARLLGVSGPLHVLSPPERIRPTVEVWYGYRRDVSQRVIRLLVGNQSQATNGIDEFGIANVPKPFATWAPPEWMGWYRYAAADSGFGWFCSDTLTPKPAGTTGSVYPSPYAIDPGDSLHTFYFYTNTPPARFSWYAAGFDTMPGIGRARPSLWQAGWTGEVVLPTVDVAPASQPKALRLRKAGPNPMSSSTTIGFELPSAEEVQLGIYDVTGRLVVGLVKGRREPGIHAAVWQGTDRNGHPCRPGVYFARLVVNKTLVGTERVTIVR